MAKIKAHAAGSATVILTQDFIRANAEVLGVCHCGKPAQTAVAHRGPDGKFTFTYECFDGHKPH